MLYNIGSYAKIIFVPPKTVSQYSRYTPHQSIILSLFDRKYGTVYTIYNIIKCVYDAITEE